MIRQRFLKYLRLVEYVLFLKMINHHSKVKTIKRIGVIVSINPDSNKFKNWHDGFTTAIEKLKNSYVISFIFFDSTDVGGLVEELNKHDFIIVKSSWRSKVDYFLRKYSTEINPFLGLMISASTPIVSRREQAFYNVIWYETIWYKNNAVNHKNAFHAFGIDTNIMNQEEPEVHKEFDVIAVGAPRKYKRLQRLLNKEGKKILIGDLKNRDGGTAKLLRKLKRGGVIIEDFQDYSSLASKYKSATLCYIPCSLHGGGERALLEARACGLKVEIEGDNPKLKELLHSPIWDSIYYAKQLEKGITSVGNENIDH